VEFHGDRLIGLFRVIERVVADGVVSPDELAALRRHIVATRHSYEPLPRQAAGLDLVMRAIGALAGAGAPTKHVKEVINETVRDGALVMPDTEPLSDAA